MAGHHNLYGHSAGPVDPVAAAAKYLESSAGKGFNTSGSSSSDAGSQKNSSVSFLPDLGKGNDGSHYQNTNNNKSYSENGTGPNDGSAAAKAYLETAKLYMDSKNYAAEVQRAYMDAAAKSIYGEGKSHDQHNSSSNSESGLTSSMDGSNVKNERADGSSPPNIHTSSSPFSNPTALASYYSQAAAAVAGQAAGGTGANAAAALSGIVPLSLSQYAPPTGTYPSPSEYRRPLPVIF